MHPLRPPTAWPLLDRGAVANAAAAHLSGSHARAVVIVGPAGVGKTVLAHQVAARLAGRRVLTVVGLAELTSVPLGAFAPLLVEAGIDAHDDRAVHAAVALLGRDPEGALVIADDAPRLDDISAAALYQAVRGFGVPMIATARQGEALPAPLARLETEGIAVRVELAGLTGDEVGTLVSTWWDAPAAHGDVVRLAARTEGNPLYLRVLLESAVREGGVSVAGGMVRIAEGDTPPDLLASLGKELAALDEGERVALRLVALTQPVDPAQVRDALTATGHAPRSLEPLTERGLVTRAPQSRLVRIGHPLVAEAIARDASTDVAVNAAVTLLMASGEPGRRYAAVRLQRAHHGRAADADLVWAAEHALALGELDAAIELARAALEHLGEGTGSARARIVLASALSVLGRLDEADVAFAAARAAATADEIVLLASRWGEHLAFRRFDVQRAIATAEELRAGLTPQAASVLDPELRLWRGIVGDARGQGGDVVGEDSHPEVAIRAAMAAIMTETMSARTEAAKEAAAVIARVQERTGVLDPMAAAVVGFDVYIDLLSRGEHERALEWARSRRFDAGDGVGIWTCTVAEHLNYNGRLSEAAPLAALAVDQCRWRDPIGVLPLALALHADVHAKRSDLAGARSILEAMEPAQRSEPKAVLLIAECEAWLAHAEGDTDRAAAIIERAAEAAMGIGFSLVAAISLGLCVRLGRVDRAAAMLDEICAPLPSHLELCFAVRDVAAALRDRAPERMAHAAQRLAAAGMAPTALDAISLARKQRPSAEVRRRLDLATLALSRDVDAPLLQSRQAPLLTARELQVALDAAGRLRSREIAELRGVSVRTVDNQLQAVYRKLGVGSRDEVRVALAEVGLLDADPVP